MRKCGRCCGKRPAYCCCFTPVADGPPAALACCNAPLLLAVRLLLVSSGAAAAGKNGRPALPAHARAINILPHDGIHSPPQRLPLPHPTHPTPGTRPACDDILPRPRELGSLWPSPAHTHTPPHTPTGPLLAGVPHLFRNQLGILYCWGLATMVISCSSSSADSSPALHMCVWTRQQQAQGDACLSAYGQRSGRQADSGTASDLTSHRGLPHTLQTACLLHDNAGPLAGTAATALLRRP